MANLHYKFRKIRLVSTTTFYVSAIGALAYTSNSFYEDWK